MTMGSPNKPPTEPTGTPTESSSLLLDSKRQTQKHEAGQVHEVELFSDLVVAVAIHSVSDVLADFVIQDQDDGTIGLRWCRFMLQVFFIWYLWQSCMMLTNLGNMFTANQLSITHYLVVFATMGFIVAFVKAGTEDGYKLGGFILIIARTLGVMAFLLEAQVTPRPEWIPLERYRNLQQLSELMAVGVIVEFSPLIVALVYCHMHHLDDMEGASIIRLGGLGMCAVVIGIRSLFAYKYDANPEYIHSAETMMDVEHLQERYSLITFIFLGELCFAAASAPDAYYESVSALVTAVGCFLLYFSARVKGRTEAWSRSAQSSILCHHLHIVLFIAIPSMGVAYVKMIHDYIHEENKAGTEEMPWYHNPHALLGLSTGAFLAIMGLLEFSTLDPCNQKPKMSQMSRVALQIAVGVIVEMLCFCFNHAATIVPVSVMTTAFLLLWGTQLIPRQFEV